MKQKHIMEKRGKLYSLKFPVIRRGGAIELSATSVAVSAPVAVTAPHS
jgi:hypothetical protein